MAATSESAALAVDTAVASPDMSAEGRRAKLQFSVTDLGASNAVGINNKGAIVLTRGSNIYIRRHGAEKLVPSACMQQAATLSDNGIVAGTGSSRPVLFHRNTCVDLGTLGGTIGDARDVNRKGQAVGSSTLAGNTVTHAFRYDDGVMRDLGTLRGGTSNAMAINERGVITGTSDGTAFLYRNNRMIDLGSLSAPNSAGPKGSKGNALNDQGDVVGSTFLPCANGEPICAVPIEHAFIYTNGRMKDIDTLDSFSSQAYSINNSGDVVGFATPTDDFSTFSGFLYTNGKMQRLTDLLSKNSPGWVIKSALSINDDGEILALAVRTTGAFQIHAVLLNPSRSY